jgi:D-alanyl-D-alanine carboxypeptidase (penicillin-binding protein 5/6)
MKKSIFSLFLCLAISAGCWAAPPPVRADFALLADNRTERVFYEKDPDSRIHPASTTKILTLITALENSDGRENVTISARAAATEGSSCYLRANERYALRELYYGMMLMSGNDAAVAIAEHIGGRAEDFVALMNKTARKIGAVNSNFTNPSGLTDDKHYTTARDMLRITRYALKNAVFARIVATDQADWLPRNAKQKTHIKNTNKLLRVYQGAFGVKTGYTEKARTCLIAGARRGELELIALIFHGEDDCSDDAADLLDYGFMTITPETVYKAGETVLVLPSADGGALMELTVREDVVLPCAGDRDFYRTEIKPSPPASVKIGQKAGLIRVLYEEKEIKTVDLVVKKQVREPGRAAAKAGE